MGQVVFEKGGMEYQMFGELYRLCEKYWIPEDTEEYWDSVTNTAKAFYKKYDSVYAKYIIYGFMNALEEVHKLQNGIVERKSYCRKGEHS